jgi:hypothetical protein
MVSVPPVSDHVSGPVVPDCPHACVARQRKRRLTPKNLATAAAGEVSLRLRTEYEIVCLILISIYY